jgi:signal peptide peptidase SppA
MSKPHALDRVMAWARNPWALSDDMLATVFDVLDRRLHEGAHALDAATLAALTGRLPDAPPPQPMTSGAVALIPLHGVIAPRINMVSDISGGTTFEGTEQALNAAVADPRVSTIVLDVDSPGGSVFGAHEFARAILKARTQKTIVAMIHPLGASAAYWAASCCTQIVASPSAQVGSIGVVGMHEDRSARLANEGIKRTLLSAGDGKTDGHPDEPLSDRARAQLLGHIRSYYALFVQDICVGRGCSAATVRDEWKAQMFTAAEALDRGLIDRVGTLAETLARFGVTAPLSSPTASATPPDTPQEPSPATGQDWAAQRALHRLVLDLAS